jgi:hypothetical protein
MAQRLSGAETVGKGGPGLGGTLAAIARAGERDGICLAGSTIAPHSEIPTIRQAENGERWKNLCQSL